MTSMIALPYAIVQGSLEVLTPDQDFYVPEKDYDLFGHGGSLFWMVSSLVFTLVRQNVKEFYCSFYPHYFKLADVLILLCWCIVICFISAGVFIYPDPETGLLAEAFPLSVVDAKLVLLYLFWSPMNGLDLVI